MVFALLLPRPLHQLSPSPACTPNPADKRGPRARGRVMAAAQGADERNEERTEKRNPKIKQHESTSQTSVALVPSSDALDSSGGTLSLHLLLLAWHLFLVAMHLILRAGLSHYTCYY